MSRHSSSTSHRRLAAWLAFGAVGLATGAVWATGFASISGVNGTQAESPALTKTAPTTATSALSNKVAPVSAIAYDWNGRWGTITTPKVMFKVDLSGSAYAGKTYNIATLLTNTSVVTGWASLQLKLERVEKAAGGTCSAADFGGNQDPQLLNIDNKDAGVYWNALDGDRVHCIGIAASAGDDRLGTFLRSADDTPPAGFPTFITTVDRAS